MSATTLMEARLKADSGVSAIVGAQIWPMAAPGSASIPYILYEKTADTPSNTANGTTTTSQKRFALSGYAATYAAAQALGDAMTAALSGWTDSAGCIWHQESCSDDMGDVEPGQSIPGWYAVNQEYTVWT